MTKISPIFNYSTWDKAKFKEICEWMEKNISGEWTTEYRFEISEASILYEKFAIKIEDEKDYLFFKIVWE